MLSPPIVTSPDQKIQYKLRSSTRQKRMKFDSSNNNFSTSNSDDSDDNSFITNQNNHKRKKSLSNHSNNNNNGNDINLNNNNSTNSLNSKKIKKQTPPEKRRVRTGCLTCRSKHKKCDETKPICKFCQSKNLQCIWPHEGMSKPSQLNDTLKQLLSLKKINNIQQNFLNENSNNSNIVDLNLDLNLNSDLSPNYLQLPSNFPSILSIIPALQSGNFSSNMMNSFIFFNDKSITSTNCLFTQSLTNLLSNYFLTDPTYILHLNNPNHILSLSRESKALTYAILAISSRILQQFDSSYNGDNTLDFYILSVRELSKYLRNQVQGIMNDNISILTKESTYWTVVLLSWFELLSVNPNEIWERIEGIINFFQSLGVLDDSKNFHTFIALIMIAWCCKIKQLENNNLDSNNSSNPKSNLMDLNTEINLSNLLSNSIANPSSNILNLTFKTFLIKNDLKQWVDIWNSLLDWKLRNSGNEEFIQSDGSIILAIDKDLFNVLFYHVACYSLLINKIENVSLIFQTPNDFTTVVAFAIDDNNNSNNSINNNKNTNIFDDLIEFHRNRLIKILKSNMITKNKKSIYSTCACWFAGYILNDDSHDNTEIKQLLQRIGSWSRLEIFKWLINLYE